MSQLHFTICEPIALGYEHVPTNVGVLKTIRFAYPDAAISFHGDASQLELLRNQVGEEIAAAVEWVAIENPPRPASFFKRLPKDFRRVHGLLKSTERNRDQEVLFFTFGNASVIWSLKLLTATLFKNRKTQVVLHGDFATLRYRTSMKFMINPLYHLSSFKTAVRFGCSKSVQYIVLEEAVRDAVLAKYPKLAGRFRVIEHPVLSEVAEATTAELSSPIKFGFLGRSSEAKGFTRYLDLAKLVSERFPGRAEFSFVGFLGPTQNADVLPNLAYLAAEATQDKLSRDDYERRVKELHFVCMFYEKEYEFAASGVLADAIEWEKPLIASDLPLFGNIKAKFPNFAYLCSNGNYLEAVEAILESPDSVRYQEQVAAMREVKKSRTPEVMAAAYRKLVDELR